MSSKKSTESAPPGTVDLATLGIPQLRALQTRLTAELEHLASSHAKLRSAQVTFTDCMRAIEDGVVGKGNSASKEGETAEKKEGEKEEDKEKAKGSSGDEILVPLTSSLYVRGRMASRERVLVDVGTGFYVEKSPADATAFYKRKADELNTNLQDLEKILAGKNSNVRVVEEVLRQKILLAQGAPPAGAAGASSSS